MTHLVLIFLAQSLIPRDGTSANQPEINANNALSVTTGAGGRPTYTCSTSGQAANATVRLTVDAPPNHKVRVLRWCVSTSSATAAAAVTIKLARFKTPSTGGNSTAEGNSNPAVAKHDPSDPAFGGRCALNATDGTSDSVIDGHSFQVGEAAVGGTTDKPSEHFFCRDYSQTGGVVLYPGTLYSIGLSITAAGTGSFNAVYSSMVFTTEFVP